MVHANNGVFRFTDQTFQSKLQKDKYYLFHCQLYTKSRFPFFLCFRVLFDWSYFQCQQKFFTMLYIVVLLFISIHQRTFRTFSESRHCWWSAWPASHFSVFDIFCYKTVNLFSNVFECIVSKLHLEVGIVACCVQMYGLVDTYQLTQD